MGSDANGFSQFHPRSFSRCIRGFTLIELLVAITILAIVAVMGWRGLDGIIRSRESLNNELDNLRRTQITFSQIENDCARMAVASVFPQHEAIAASTHGLVLIRQIFEEKQPIRLQVVTYRLQGDILVRRESPVTRDLKLIGVYWDAAMDEHEDFPSVNLQKKVQSLTLRTWTPSDHAWANVDDNSDVLTRLLGGDLTGAGNDSAQTGGQAPAPPGAPQGGASPQSNLKAGLEVSILAAGQSKPMVKIMLLGGG